jgi:hypothetical protein
LHVKSDSYYGTDYVQEVLLHVQDASKLEEEQPVVKEIVESEDEGMFLVYTLADD